MPELIKCLWGLVGLVLYWRIYFCLILFVPLGFGLGSVISMMIPASKAAFQPWLMGSITISISVVGIAVGWIWQSKRGNLLMSNWRIYLPTFLCMVFGFSLGGFMAAAMYSAKPAFQSLIFVATGISITIMGIVMRRAWQSKIQHGHS